MFDFLKSQKEIYDDTLKQKRQEAIKKGEYEITPKSYHYNKEERYYTTVEQLSKKYKFPSIIDTETEYIIVDNDDFTFSFKNELLNDWLTGNEYYIFKMIKNHKTLVEKEQVRIREEQAEEDYRIMKMKEDEFYSKKLEKLLKLKPLDKDIKESLDKTKRILEIWKEITKLTNEIKKLRNN